MTRFALRGLLSRKLRTALTAIAIVLGVGMISGTFVLTDSISHAFDRIFTDARKGSDAVISGKSAFDTSSSDASLTPTFDESLLSKVRQQPGVAQAEGSVSTDSAHLIDKNGKVISTVSLLTSCLYTGVPSPPAVYFAPVDDPVPVTLDRSMIRMTAGATWNRLVSSTSSLETCA